jgi:hypothetical protein
MLGSFLLNLPNVVFGVLVITGGTLALARKCPVTRLTGLALELPGWIFWALLNSDTPHHVIWTVACSVMAAWTFLQVWLMREQFR